MFSQTQLNKRQELNAALRSFLKVTSLSQHDRIQIKATLKAGDKKPLTNLTMLVDSLNNEYRSSTTHLDENKPITYCSTQLDTTSFKDKLYPVINSTNNKTSLLYSSELITSFFALDETLKNKFNQLVNTGLHYCRDRGEQGIKSLGHQQSYYCEISVNGHPISTLALTHELKVKSVPARIGICTLRPDKVGEPTILYACIALKKGLHKNLSKGKIYKSNFAIGRQGFFAKSNRCSSDTGPKQASSLVLRNK